MDPIETGAGDVELIYVVQPRVQWRGFVRVPWRSGSMKSGEFLKELLNNRSFSRKSPLFNMECLFSNIDDSS